jgi:hypothetical protein
MTSNPQEGPAEGRLRFRVPGDLEPTYANLAAITHSASEILIDFAQVMPQIPEARVKSRIVLTPMNAKLLRNALAEHLSRFEAEHGEIRLPERPTLAEHLFRQSKQDEGDKPDGKGEGE